MTFIKNFIFVRLNIKFHLGVVKLISTKKMKKREMVTHRGA